MLWNIHLINVGRDKVCRAFSLERDNLDAIERAAIAGCASHLASRGVDICLKDDTEMLDYDVVVGGFRKVGEVRIREVGIRAEVANGKVP